MQEWTFRNVAALCPKLVIGNEMDLKKEKSSTVDFIYDDY